MVVSAGATNVGSLEGIKEVAMKWVPILVVRFGLANVDRRN